MLENKPFSCSSPAEASKSFMEFVQKFPILLSGDHKSTIEIKLQEANREAQSIKEIAEAYMGILKNYIIVAKDFKTTMLSLFGLFSQASAVFLKSYILTLKYIFYQVMQLRQGKEVGNNNCKEKKEGCCNDDIIVWLEILKSLLFHMTSEFPSKSLMKSVFPLEYVISTHTLLMNICILLQKEEQDGTSQSEQTKQTPGTLDSFYYLGSSLISSREEVSEERSLKTGIRRALGSTSIAMRILKLNITVDGMILMARLCQFAMQAPFMTTSGEGMTVSAYELAIEFLRKSNTTEATVDIDQAQILPSELAANALANTKKAHSPPFSMTFRHAMLKQCKYFLRILALKHIPTPAEKRSLEIMKSYLEVMRSKLRTEMGHTMFHESLALLKVMKLLLIASRDAFKLIQEFELKDYFIGIMEGYIIAHLRILKKGIKSDSSCNVLSRLFNFLVQGSTASSPEFSAFFYSLIKELIVGLSQYKQSSEPDKSTFPFLQDALLQLVQLYIEKSPLNAIEMLFNLLNSGLVEFSDLEGKLTSAEIGPSAGLLQLSNSLFALAIPSNASESILLKLLTDFMLQIMKHFDSYLTILNIYKLMYCGIVQRKRAPCDSEMLTIFQSWKEEGMAAMEQPVAIHKGNAALWFNEFIVKLINIVMDYYKKYSIGRVHKSSIILTENIIQYWISASLARTDIQEMLMTMAISLKVSRQFIYGIWEKWVGKFKFLPERPQLNFLFLKSMISVLLEKSFTSSLASDARTFYYGNLDILIETTNIRQDLQYFVRAMQFLKVVVVGNPDNKNFSEKALVKKGLIEEIARELIVEKRQIPTVTQATIILDSIIDLMFDVNGYMSEENNSAEYYDEGISQTLQVGADGRPAAVSTVKRLPSKTKPYIKTNALLISFLHVSYFMLKKSPFLQEIIDKYLVRIFYYFSPSFARYLYIAESPIATKLIIKLIFKLHYNGAMKTLIDFFTIIAAIHISPTAMKQFVRKLQFYKRNHEKYMDLAKSIMDCLLRLVNRPEKRSPPEIFLFSGNRSGVKLAELGPFPKTGYCAFGWIRLEGEPRNEKDDSMMIYKLEIGTENEIQLYLDERRHLIYNVAIQSDSKSESSSVNQSLDISSFPADEWIFLELYHLNDGTVLCFMNSRQIFKAGHHGTFLFMQASPGKQIPIVTPSVGSFACKKPISAEIDAPPRNCFKGAISAFYFMQVSTETHSRLHSTLSNIFRDFNFSDLLNFVPYGMKWQGISSSWRDIEELAFQEKVFLAINPITFSEKERLRIFPSGQPGNKSCMNQLQELYAETIIKRNTPAESVIWSIGGPRIVLPFVAELAEPDKREESAGILKRQEPNFIYRMSMSETILAFIVKLIKFSPQMALCFLEYDGGISIMRYLLERLAKKVPLTQEVFKWITALMDFIVANFPHLVGAYSEMILLNGDIWIHSNEEVQQEIVRTLEECSKIKNPQANIIFDSLLNCIEIYSNQSDSGFLTEKYISQFSQAALSVAGGNLDADLIKKLMSYACKTGRLVRYGNQIYYVMMIFHGIYVKSKSFSRKEANQK